MTALGLVVVSGLLALAAAVPSGALDRFDRAVLEALHGGSEGSGLLAPVRRVEWVRDLTALGSVALLWVLTGAAALYLVLDRRPGDALFVWVVLLGSGLLVDLLKGGFERPRPELVGAWLRVFGWSFPSGHSLMATAVLPTLGALLSRRSRRCVRIGVPLLGGVLALIVGASRVALGVHWPSDVLAGWLAGALWAGLCWEGRRFLARPAGG